MSGITQVPLSGARLERPERASVKDMLNSPTRRRQEPPSEPPSVRVLLVDDDENFRAWLTKLMRRLGFAVATADDG